MRVREVASSCRARSAMYLTLAFIFAPTLMGCRTDFAAVECPEDGLTNELEISPGKILRLTALQIADPKPYWEVSLDFTEMPTKGGTVWHVALPPLLAVSPKADYCARVRLKDNRLFLLSLWDQRYYMIDLNTGRIVRNVPASGIVPEFRHEGHFLKLEFVGGQVWQIERR